MPWAAYQGRKDTQGRTGGGIMTKKKPQHQDIELIIRNTPNATNYRIENGMIYICTEKGFILKSVRKE